MEAIKELEKKIKKFRYVSEVIQWVEVTHIKDPGHFYARPYDYHQYLSFLEYRAFWETINPSSIRINSMIIYYSATLNKHVRGQVLDIGVNNEKITYEIFALDYGCIDKNVPINSITKACYDTKSIQPLVHCCKLFRCQPVQGTIWPDSAINAMKFYVGKKPILMIIKEITYILSVELNNKSRDDVATVMALKGYSTLGLPSPFVNRIAVPEPEYRYIALKTLSVGDVLHVRIQSIIDYNEFYVVEPMDYKVYSHLMSSFTYFSNLLEQLPLEDFKENTPVGVFIMKQCKYERGIVKKIMFRRAQVLLIDCGKVIEVSRSMLKPLSKKFYFYPAAAIYCSLADWNINMTSLLQSSSEILITITQVGFNFDIPNSVTVSEVSDSGY